MFPIRDDNPTCRVVEKMIAALEGANDSVISTTGMAALTMVFLTYLESGDHLLTFHDVYGAKLITPDEYWNEVKHRNENVFLYAKLF